jgi:hypothetical protein
MKSLYASLSKDILQQTEFKEDYKTLFKAYILSLIGDHYDKPSREIGLRLTKSAQILVASGNSENIEMGIRIIDMFMEVIPSYLEDILIIAETTFSFLGNYPNIELINTRWQARKRISLSITSILAEEIHRNINTIELLGIDATDFQVNLWNDLQGGNDVVTIAPTSTGKSYIIIQYIIQSMNIAPNDRTYAVYIVPSRALIYEISRKFQNLLFENEFDDIDIATVAQREKKYDRKTIFVLTQERMLMLLHFQPLMRFSYIVIDEAQNIAAGSRGVLLHIAIANAVNRGPVQLIFSTPSMNFENTFNFLLGNNNNQPCTTEHSPVSKNYIFAKCQGNKIVLSTRTPEIEISIPKKFSGINYYKIVKRLGDRSNNIVYANTKSECERIVKKLLTEVTIENPKLYDASDYIKKTVHEEYSLAEAIKKGIVFHYGPLPRNIRIMIENCVEEKLIDYVVCTSTLAEGVNMPAQNLFIRDPKTYSTKAEPAHSMSSVQFKNIIGRAGRLMRHFSGNVFYVDYENWEFPECLQENSEEHKLPTYFKVLRENTEDIISLIKEKRINDGVDIQTLNATLNKLLQDRQEGRLADVLEQYVDSNKHRKLIDAIETLCSNLEITDAILRLNPTIGAIQQNNLYKYLNDLDDMHLLKPRLPYDDSFYSYLRHNLLPLLLDFDLLKLKTYGDMEKYYDKICIITNRWVKGISLKDIIQGSIRQPGNKKIDDVVKDTVQLIDNIIRFRLANAIKCFCDIFTLVASQKGEEPDEIPEFYSFLEIGACDNLMIGLISVGLSRQTAIEVSKVIHNIDVKRGDIINQIKKNPHYTKLHKITRKEIEVLRN